MSGRLVATHLATLARRTPLLTPRLYTTHTLPAGGLLRNEAGLRLVKRRPWPLGTYALHNLPATRSISFARVIPKLVTKLATAGAAAGGAVIAGVSYIQFQAGRASKPPPCVCRCLQLTPRQRPGLLPSTCSTAPRTALRSLQAVC